MKLSYSQIAVLITSTLLGNVGAEVLKVKVGNPERLEKRSINESYVTNYELKHGLFQGTIEIGTPTQKVTVGFDTGSYTLAVNYADSVFCQENDCVTYGSFDPSLSSSSVNTTSDYSSRYADGSGGTGHYFNDTLSIGGLTMDDYKFGLVETSNSEMNIMGLSLIADDDAAPVLYNFLYHSGLIARKVYSSYYSTSQGEGAFVFGGLDEARYTGTLERVLSFDSISYSPILTGVSNDCGDVNTNGYMILFDTGAEMTILPEELYHQIHQSFGGKTTNVSIQSFEDGPIGTIDFNYIFKCSAATPLYLDFSGKKVTFKPENFLITLYDGDSPLTDEDGDQLCITKIFNGQDGEDGYVFGEDLFKSIFVVWDVDNNDIAIADSIDATEEELVEITGDVPNAVKAKDYDSPNSNTEDTSYASPSTASLTVTTVLTSGAYTGPFSTGSCTSSSSSASSISSTNSASSISSTNPASFTSANSSQSSSQAASSSTASSQGSSLAAESSEINSGTTTVYSASYDVTSTATCVLCSSINKPVTIETTSFSTTSEATCLSCTASSSIASSSSVSSGSVSSESSITTESHTIATSTYFEHENSTVIKTITSCSNDVCSKITTTSVFIPTSSESSVGSTSETTSISTSDTTSIKPVESTSSIIESKSESIETTESSITSSEVETSLGTSPAESSTIETTPIPSSTSTPTSIAGVPTITSVVEPSSSLIQTISSNSDTTVTVQTYITVSKESSSIASSSSVYQVSSPVISTYEGAASIVEIPSILKFFSLFF